jgi:hypothetical protein
MAGQATTPLSFGGGELQAAHLSAIWLRLIINLVIFPTWKRECEAFANENGFGEEDRAADAKLEKYPPGEILPSIFLLSRTTAASICRSARKRTGGPKSAITGQLGRRTFL